MVIATCIPRLHFIGLKAKCDNGAREQGNLVYDQGRRELSVEIHSNGAAKRHGVEAALKMDGSDDLQLGVCRYVQGQTPRYERRARPNELGHSGFQSGHGSLRLVKDAYVSKRINTIISSIGLRPRGATRAIGRCGAG